ncbi:MAG: hypothetical protein QW356_06410 [Candidatus Hadarchaeales archaeon]
MRAGLIWGVIGIIVALLVGNLLASELYSAIPAESENSPLTGTKENVGSKLKTIFNLLTIGVLVVVVFAVIRSMGVL